MIINTGSIIVLLIGLLLSQVTGFVPPSLLSSGFVGRYGSITTTRWSQQHQQQIFLWNNNDGVGDNENENVPVVRIALTREQGNNEKLRQQLMNQFDATNKLEDVEIVELPCIAHADGPDYDKLQSTLIRQHWDYVTITSPEAARVLASAWSSDAFGNHPIPAVAAVGKATEETLTEAGIPVAFCPSKATAKVLVQELPMVPTVPSTATSRLPTVLYPASARAETTLQDGLTERGFAVTRLNTYDTVTATWTDEQKVQAVTTQIVCVASPSSIQGWLANTPPRKDKGGEDEPFSFLVACIGETSAQACRTLGFAEEQIFYPKEKPGIPGWADAVKEAVESLSSSSNNGSRSFHQNPAMTATD
jgi:uroporphyrinogen-III synthase